ncbi:hypothetical protein M422DRAFT_258377 [Sphaerobolus stellatus SS14]|uniref:Unplaced genomic scaffold SPHSTscaffold_81, whole genome shotgun sequence n=1 Tax=Sphaerobolus stellatus (strain SS14) TaxID=990650 RepID=A0A0C9VBP9_SPHS4|nr:hypothetical protein M422DRAFT_258377 [Sphaerobolus stellatus SS14]
MLEPGNNQAHDKAAAKAATQRIIDQMSMMEPAPGSGAEERARTTRSRIPGDRYSWPPLSRDIHENIPHPACSEQSDDSQLRRGREMHTVPSLLAEQVIWGIPESIECSWYSITDPQSIDMNALREEIKETISATIKEKLRSDADSVTTVSQSMQALDANAQYWSDLSNKATRCNWRALELQLKLAEEKVNNLLHEEAPEEALLEAAQEARTIHFQLDQNMRLCKAGLMPEQQVRFSANTGREVTSPSRNYGVNPINELDGAVVDMTSEYSGIQQMVRQALKNASHEEEPEKSFLAKAGVKMGDPPTYSSERNLEKFKTWVASCLTDEAQEWFYRQVERFDREIKHWDLESIMMGLQKWFMPTLSLNKVAVGYDRLMQGSMTVQQLHQQLTKLAKQMVELPDAYSYRRRFMDALKPDIRDLVLRKGFTAKFSKIDELVEQAVTLDNAKCYTSGYNSNQSSSYVNRTATAEHSRAPHTTTQNKSSNPNAGSSNQHKSGSNPVQNRLTTQLLLTGGVGIPTQSNPIRTAAKANDTVVCFNCNQPEFDEYAPHPEEQQEYEDQPEEDDQQYRFDDEEYETRSIDNEVVHVNAVIKASGYNDCHRLYGIRVREAETDLRVSAVLQTGGKEQPVYDYRARKKARPLPTRGKENETISVFCDIVGTKAHCLLDSGCEGIMISSDFVRANKLPKFELEKPVILQLACEKYDEYFDIANVDYYNAILGTLFLRQFEILLDFKNNCVQIGKISFPNRFGSITPTEADEDEARLQKEKPKALPAPTSKGSQEGETSKTLPIVSPSVVATYGSSKQGSRRTEQCLYGVQSRISLTTSDIPVLARSLAEQLIDLSKVIRDRTPRCPEALKEQLIDKINQYVTAGWWRQMSTQQAVPMLCLPKKTGKLRTVFDKCLQNENTVKDVRSKIDLTEVYEQIRIVDRDVDKSGFSTIFGT